MKTKEELNAIKEEVETVGGKLRELTEEELTQVTGGNGIGASIYEMIASIVEWFGKPENTQPAFGVTDGVPSGPLPSHGNDGIPSPEEINGRK